MKKLISLGAISLLCSWLLACSEKTADKIGDAQHCLDEYSQNGGGDLTTCEAKIAGIETPAAYGIRCAVGYIREGFTTQTFISAFNEIETVDATNVQSFLNILTFDAAGTSGSSNLQANLDNSSTVYNYCLKSLGKGATVLATFTYLINALYDYECDRSSSCAVNNATNFTNALANGYVLNTATEVNFRTGLGDVVDKTYQLSCTAGEANETLCNFLKRAINGAVPAGDKNEIGRKFLEVIASP